MLIVSALWASSCAVPLGPGYTIEKQQVQVQFLSEPEPRIRIDSDYHLKNTGNRPLNELEMRLPGRRRFRYEQPVALWDSTAVSLGVSADQPRDTLIAFAEPWAPSARHTLHLSVEYLPSTAGEASLSFSNDAFFLPEQGWSPELLPARGLFATGGVPPKKWELEVRTPQGFMVHTGGKQSKASHSGGEFVLRAELGTNDRYPFVIAGRYKDAEIGEGRQKIRLWTREPWETTTLSEVSEAFARTFSAYDSVLGARTKVPAAIWIVECPVVSGCFTNPNAPAMKLLNEEEKEPASAEMVSQDTLMVDLRGGAHKLAVAVAPSLAASWLGYGQNPGFYEQDPPLSLLPAFAASIGREAAEGSSLRSETIREALRLIPNKLNAQETEGPAAVRAKSLLFFFALQDLYGREVFRKALQHMLNARRGRGFELNDLISAFDQETHQDTAEFVRRWLKRPGVPEDFRQRYEKSAAANAAAPQESAP